MSYRERIAYANGDHAKHHGMKAEGVEQGVCLVCLRPWPCGNVGRASALSEETP